MFRCGGGYVHTISWWVALCIKDFENQLNLVQETGNHDEIHVKVWAKFVEERFWELELCFVLGELLQRTKCCRKGLHWCSLKVTGGGGGQISGVIRGWNGDCVETAIWCIVVASQTYSPFLHHSQALHGRPRPWWCWWHLSLIPYNKSISCQFLNDVVVYFLWFYVFEG